MFQVDLRGAGFCLLEQLLERECGLTLGSESEFQLGCSQVLPGTPMLCIH